MPLTRQQRIDLLEKVRLVKQQQQQRQQEQRQQQQLKKKQLKKKKDDIVEIIETDSDIDSDSDSEIDIDPTKRIYKIPKEQEELNYQIYKNTKNLMREIKGTISLHIYQVDKGKICNIEVVEDLYHSLIKSIKIYDTIRELFLQKAKHYNNKHGK